ncbi:RHS repeat-associated core domain-containing protein [Yokenella regensburgei]|uniref:RHS repeat-associated core domain-containing protein n=1 Tax=Yokenella regensburgei TaxID=158877 RepID=UPI001432D9CA|nr:RHS repeat-associated core domain-containing protein [Yokenella regensburgei]QIU88415.1 type IV secretion protein Rhs [Yokenella regensburgei]
MLNLTRYNSDTGELFLSSGESYRIRSEERAQMQKRFINFIFKKTSGKRFEIIYKSGLVEHLSALENNMAYVRKITDNLGRSIYFEWDNRPMESICYLLNVKDEDGKLCQMTYPDNNNTNTILKILPDKAECSYDITFSFYPKSETETPAALAEIVNSADAPILKWIFTYDKPNKRRGSPLLTAVSFPTGLQQEVTYTYAKKAMQFPYAIGLPPLPCVTKHILKPGGGQSNVITSWEWTEENYLAFNSKLRREAWQPDKDLMALLALKSGYFYGSTAKIMDEVSLKVLSSVKRRYNSDHLLVSESTLRDGKQYTVAIEYYASPESASDERLARYLLPQRQIQTWKNNDGGTRSDITLWEYDIYGNIQHEMAPDRSSIYYTYYPAEGENDACPADPYGFIRYLKQKSVVPSKVKGDEPDIITFNTWKKINTLSGESYAVVGNEVEELTGETRCVTNREYYDDIKNTLTFGREKERKTTLTPDKSVNKSYISLETYIYEVSEQNFIQNATMKTHDDLTLSRQTTRHISLGYLLAKKNAQDVLIKYEYDKLGNIKKQLNAAETEYESTTILDYRIEGSGPVITQSPSVGNPLKTYYDCAGRVVKQECFDKDDSNKWYEISSQNYNRLGQIRRDTVKDWLAGGTAATTEYVNRNEYTYDGWGNIHTASSSDGIDTSQIFDAIALSQVSFSRGYSTDGSNLNSWTFTTIFDERSKLPKYERVTSDTSESQRYFEWDGIGRLREAVDELEHITKWTYDAFGRVLTQTLPDASVVTRTYAPHLTGNQIASISVTGKDGQGKTKTWVLGTQEFDGLARLTKRTSGGRTTIYTYDSASSLNPSSVTLPSGKKISYNYIAALGDALNVASSGDEFKQNFTYDKRVGKLATADVFDKGITDTKTWNPSGSLKKDAAMRKGEGTRNATYVHTIAGNIAKYSDFTTNVTEYHRDSFGRVVSIIDENTTEFLSYDLLGRLNDFNGTSYILPPIRYNTHLEFDGAGRETSRTIRTGHVTKLSIEQIWTENSLLKERVTKQLQNTLRDEKYNYDVRNRLTTYTVTGSSLPLDAYGYQMKKQEYQYDALNNLISVKTTLASGEIDTATYIYGKNTDPTQLTSVTHTHDQYPQSISLEYDLNGYMTKNEAGNTLAYDVTGCLISVNGNKISGSYSYDAFNRLVRQKLNNNDSRELYYRGKELVNESLINKSFPEKNRITRLIKVGHSSLVMDSGTDIAYIASDQHGSILLSNNTEGEKSYTWPPYGNGKGTDLLPGFNGERVDPLTGMYHLGNGYRAYNPVLMRFNCPDDLSPFGPGGINPYAYCAGDPINLTDPSGHTSYLASTLMIAVGIGGLAAALLTAGISIAAAGGIAAAISAASTTSLVVGGLGVVADVTGIASLATETTNPQASSVLGWIALGAGGVGLGIGAAGAARGILRGGRGGGGGFSKFYKPAHFSTLDQVQTYPLVNAPREIWIAERLETSSQWGSQYVYGANREITGYNLQEPLRALARRNSVTQRPINILTGSHGDEYGYNWVQNRSGNIFRSPSLLDPDFLKEDLAMIANINSNQISSFGSRLNAVDLDGMTAQEFSSYVTDPSNHIILAYCFGRNDELFRHTRNLNSVISYVS